MRETGKISKEELHHLEIKDGENPVILDGMPLKYVKEYRIESPAGLSGTAELSLKIWVRYP